jgi:hypothetical protein
MRNSLLPIIMIVVTVAASLWLIRGGAERGMGGPAVFAGIHKLPTKASKLTPSTALQTTQEIAGNVPAGSGAWRVLLLAGDEQTPLTNTVLLALAEEATRRGCIAVLDPHNREASEPLPLGADGMLRLTSTSQTLPVGGPGAIDFTTRLELVPVRVPVNHPAARWFPDVPASEPTVLTIRHHSSPTGKATWPSWYAAIGRAVAIAALDRLAIPATTTDTAVNLALTAWIQPGQTENDSPFGRIPAPPQGDVAERLVAFQHPFVRGWVGRLSPVPISARDGSLRTSRDELIRRLERGGWKTSAPDTWSKDDLAKDGTLVHRSISLQAETLVEWQERPQPTSLWQAWKTAGTTVQLERHRGTTGIPADLK